MTLTSMKVSFFIWKMPYNKLHMRFYTYVLHCVLNYEHCYDLHYEVSFWDHLKLNVKG